MKHTIRIIFGKEDVDNYLRDGDFTQTLEGVHIKEFYFETESEKMAFCKGIDEAIGWLEYCIVDNQMD